MPFTIEPYPHRLQGLSDFLEAVAPQLAAGAEEEAVRGAAEIVGPFPSRTLATQAFLAGDLDQAAVAGWRALVRRAGRAWRLADITVLPDGELAYSLRGEAAAQAFEAALEVASSLAEQPARLDIRWLSLPDVYVTALWVEAGDGAPRFVPTRLGQANRPDAEIYSFQRLATVVQGLSRVSRAGGAPAPTDVLPGSRSGPA